MRWMLLALAIANLVILVKNFKEYVRYKKLVDQINHKRNYRD